MPHENLEAFSAHMREKEMNYLKTPMWAVAGCDDRGVTVERTGADPETLADSVASWAQQEEDKWPDMGLLYMLIPPEQVPAARALEEETADPRVGQPVQRCPHGTVESANVRCRECNRESEPSMPEPIRDRVYDPDHINLIYVEEVEDGLDLIANSARGEAVTVGLGPDGVRKLRLLLQRYERSHRA